MATTKELENEIKRVDDINRFLSDNITEFHSKKLSDYLIEMLIKYNIEKKDVIMRSEINLTYGYQVFDGRKQPKRNKIIQICFGFPLTVEELQLALRYGGVNELYPRVKRDAYIMFAADKKYSIYKLNELLYSQNEEEIE
jgi:hypothetical protein